MSVSIIGIAKSIIGLVPGLSRWFTDQSKDSGKAHVIAKRVIEIAKSITGTKDVAKALSILQTNPTALLDFQKQVLSIERDLEEAYLQDKQDARYRDMAYIQAGRQNKRADIMVVAAALGLLSCLLTLCLFNESLPGEAVGIISTIAGIFGSCLKDAYSFEFGSSRGSKIKDFASFLQD